MSRFPVGLADTAASAAASAFASPSASGPCLSSGVFGASRQAGPEPPICAALGLPCLYAPAALCGRQADSRPHLTLQEP